MYWPVRVRHPETREVVVAMAAINAVVIFILGVERSNESLMLRVEVRELF